MTWEMAMNGIAGDAPYVAAILGATLGLVTFGLFRIKEMERKARFYGFIQEETESALISADRVLKNGATPAVVRRTLLCMLETLASAELGRLWTEKYASLHRESQRKRKPGASNDLAEAMDKLHAQNPALAADAHNALMGIILALPIMHADKVEVLEYAGEGATNPASVFEKAARALSGVNRHDDGKPGIGGGFAVA